MMRFLTRSSNRGVPLVARMLIEDSSLREVSYSLTKLSRVELVAASGFAEVALVS